MRRRTSHVEAEQEHVRQRPEGAGARTEQAIVDAEPQSEDDVEQTGVHSRAEIRFADFRLEEHIDGDPDDEPGDDLPENVLSRFVASHRDDQPTAESRAEGREEDAADARPEVNEPGPSIVPRRTSGAERGLEFV